MREPTGASKERHEAGPDATLAAAAPMPEAESSASTEPSLVALFTDVVGTPIHPAPDDEDALRLVLQVLLEEKMPPEAAEAFHAALVAYGKTCERRAVEPSVREFAEGLLVPTAAGWGRPPLHPQEEEVLCALDPLPSATSAYRPGEGAP